MKKDESASFKQSTVLPWIEMRVANQSRACYEAHSHDEFSFGMIEQGSAEYRNRHKIHRIGNGDMVTINPGDVHSCNPDKGTWSYNMLFVDAKELGDVQRDVLQQTCLDYVPFNADVSENPLTFSRFQSLLNALGDESSRLQAQACVYDFVESCWGVVPTYGRNNFESVDPGIGRIKEKLLDEIDNAHQLEDLAKEAGMSRYQLLRAFKNEYGLPPYAFLIDERIKRAKVMLKTGQTISDVALQLGFSDQAHFQRHFKKKLAVTPRYYQSHFENPLQKNPIGK
ncbi:AraC family transcriptional regulator [Parasalinivibrio latis]|uniref:AraC family transcriptional regulator n=1 Tax=Parasalinivibrio latis TaxID=2952610 RepID=UPI0030DF651A